MKSEFTISKPSAETILANLLYRPAFTAKPQKALQL